MDFVGYFICERGLIFIVTSACDASGNVEKLEGFTGRADGYRTGNL